MLGTRNHSYTVELYVQVSPVEMFVFARHDNGRQWATWNVTDMNRTGSWAFYHGHYILNRDEALIDFWLRVRRYCDFKIAYLEDNAKRF